MEATAAELARLAAFARAMEPTSPPVDRGLDALRALLQAARVPYVLVGGVAVVHHGYARTTRDVDVLLDSEAWSQVEGLLRAHGFERTARNRLRHLESGVEVDLLFAGEPLPRHPERSYPSPSGVRRSSREADVVALSALLELKLDAGRHQDTADVVALLKGLDETAYLQHESEVRPDLRRRLYELRQDALEELQLGG